MSDQPELADAVVLGGGAAGFLAAITCAEENPSLKVILLEAGPHPLAKVRISGGGRCNVTHHCFDPAELVKSYPRGAKELRGPFARFQPRDTVAWFEERGVSLKTEEDGRIFPVTDSSETIARCLEDAARKAGVILRTEARAEYAKLLETEESHLFEIHVPGRTVLRARKILLATGSAPIGYKIAESLGHTVTPRVPSLFTFKIRDPRLAGLSGISFPKAALRLSKNGKSFGQEGPLLITHEGLSGPAVLKLSAFAARELAAAGYKASLRIDFAPSLTAEKFRKKLERLREEEPKKSLRNALPVSLPRRFWAQLVDFCAGGKEIPCAQASNKLILRLTEEIKDGRYEILGKSPFKEEFVTCGGVELSEVDFRTMESKKVPGLHFAGEILDIDALTGGFNLQASWTAGWIAGKHLAES